MSLWDRWDSLVCRPHSLNIFSSETAWPIKVKFHMAPPWDGRTKVCSNGPGHMTKMAAMPIYVKNLKKIFFGTKGSMTLKLGMQHRVLEYYQVCSNDDPGLTLTTLCIRDQQNSGLQRHTSRVIIATSQKTIVCFLDVNRIKCERRVWGEIKHTYLYFSP